VYGIEVQIVWLIWRIQTPPWGWISVFPW